MCLFVGGVVTCFLVMEAIGGSNLGLGSVDSMGGLDSRMDRSDERFAGAHEIRCGGHYNAEVSVHATAAFGVDRASISEDLFFQLFDGGSSGLCGDGCERHMGKWNRFRHCCGVGLAGAGYAGLMDVADNQSKWCGREGLARGAKR